MTDFGIKVSEEGFDVNTAEDKNLLLKTGMYLPKVFDEGEVDIAGQDTTINHNLGYEPQYLAWIFNDNYKAGNGAHLVTGLSDVGWAYVNTSVLFISAPMAIALHTYYYIFYEPLSTGTAPSVTSTNDFGIKVTIEGADVSDANILEQTYNSEKNSIKIASHGNESNTVNTSYNFVITHGLDVTPGFLVFFEVDNSGKWWSAYETETLSGKNVVVDPYTTSTQLVVQASSDSSCTVKIKYYIFVNPAQ